METHKQSETSNKTTMIWLSVVAAALIIGFFAAFQFAKGSDKPNTGNALTPSLSTSGGQQQMMGPGGGTCANGQPKAMLMISGQQVESCGMPASGQVTSVSSDAVTITDKSTGEPKTFKLAADTKFTKKDGAATLAEVVTGTTVVVITNSDDQTLADYIILNPPQ